MGLHTSSFFELSILGHQVRRRQQSGAEAAKNTQEKAINDNGEQQCKFNLRGVPKLPVHAHTHTRAYTHTRVAMRAKALA
jgi:hypothetical protein